MTSDPDNVLRQNPLRLRNGQAPVVGSRGTRLGYHERDVPRRASGRSGRIFRQAYLSAPRTRADPAELRSALTPRALPESPSASSASLFPDDDRLPPHERRRLSLRKADEATHIDELIEKLETEMSSSETFAALFAFKLNGKAGQLPGGRVSSKAYESRQRRVNSNTTLRLHMMWPVEYQ